MANRYILVVCCFAMLLLNGCEWIKHKPAAAKADTNPVAVRSKAQDEEMLSLNERQMVLLFKALIRIDNKEGLGFTRGQAEELLPVIRRNSMSGELSQVDHSKIMGMLTAAQKRYYDEIQKRTESPEIDSALIEASLPEERERLILEYERRRLKEWEQGGEHAYEKARSTDSADGNPAPSGGKNIEQLLLELLESKLRP